MSAKPPRGRPFRKGMSGNPGGRPAVLESVRDLARQHMPAVIAELARIALHGESDTVRVAAARELLDRAYGKPTQPVTGEDGAPLSHRVEMVIVRPEDVKTASPIHLHTGVPRHEDWAA